MARSLPLKEVGRYELRTCDLSGKIMMGGDWYYEDTNGKIYLYEAYHQRKQEIERRKTDLSKLHEAHSKTEYKEMLKRYEREVLQADLDASFCKDN